MAFLQKVGLVWQLRHHLKRISNSKRTLYWSKDRVSGINQNNSSVVKKIVVASFFLKAHSKKKSAFMNDNTVLFSLDKAFKLNSTDYDFAAKVYVFAANF